jgi:hypothetical protein
MLFLFYYFDMYQWIFLFLFLLGCGNSPKTLGNPKVKNEEKVVTCPATAPVAFHQVTIQFSNSPPTRFSVLVDGERKIDECRSVPKEPPLVKLKREAGNKISVVVEHKDAYPELPETISIFFNDLGTCNKEEPFLQLLELPLKFEQEFPNGDKCPGRQVAKVEVIKR